jgi:hypothetical protein
MGLATSSFDRPSQGGLGNKPFKPCTQNTMIGQILMVQNSKRKL